MSPEAQLQDTLEYFVIVVVALAVMVQFRVIQGIARHGGQVRTDEFRMPDGLVAIVLATFFVGTGIAGILHHAAKGDAVTVEKVIPGSFLYIILAAGVAGFLKYRGLRLIPLFGLDRLSPLRVAGWTLGLFFVALALANTANAISLSALRGDAEQQPLVQLFRDVAQRNDLEAMAQILLAGVVFAPLCEEFLFRGFFYAVGKRYLGPFTSAFASALLFSAYHLSLTALAGLFVLALCLTLAYERTGSLLVPIGIHALYNFTSLFFIYLQGRGILTPP